MKTKIFLCWMCILGMAGLLVAQENAPAEPAASATPAEVKLADLLNTMITGPEKASDNGSTFETPKPHTPGPHEEAFATWQNICHEAGRLGNSVRRDDVAKQMKDALASDQVPGWIKVWLIKQFQWIGNETDVDALIPFVTNTEYTLRDEAIRTLSKIPGRQANIALRKALKNANEADKLIIESALIQERQDISVNTRESAMPMAIPYAGVRQVDAWVAGFNNLTPELKLQTIASLAARGDRRYRPFVLKAFEVQGEDADAFRRAGLLALERLGTSADIPLLVKNLEFDRGLVIQIASVLTARGFDNALIKALNTCDNMDTFNALARILANRYNTDVAKMIVAKIGQKDCPNRVELLAAALSIANGDQRAELIDVLALIPAGKDRESAEKLFAAACDGNSAIVLAKERDLNLTLSLLGRIGDDAAWNVVNSSLEKPELKDAALRALCNLPNAKQAARMMEVVEKEGFTPEQKIAALRAYIRVVSLPDEKIGIEATSAQKLEMLRAALAKATRVDEKRLILSRLSAIRDVESGKFALEFLDDAELEQDACRALIDLAHHNGVRRPNAEFFVPALDRVIEKCKDAELLVRAKKYRESM